MDSYSVYQLISPDGRSYIGATRQALNRRWHRGHGYRNNSVLWADIQKYGWEEFQKVVHAFDLSQEDAHALEVELIAKYDSTNPERGYNRSVGGPHGRSGCPAGEKTRLLISEELKGKRKGVPLTPEHRMRISAGLKGHGTSDETRCKLRKALGDRMKTPSARAAHLRNTKRGEEHGMARKVLCVETGKLFSTIGEAAKSIGRNRNSIANAASGRQETAGGYHWKFIKENAL